MEYYSPEELDAMPVGTRLKDWFGDEAIKVAETFESDSGWTYYPETPALKPLMSEDLADTYPKPLSDDLSSSQPTYPTPTLGELVALRESYRKDVDNALEADVHTEGSLQNLLDKWEHLNRLIDDRIGL